LDWIVALQGDGTLKGLMIQCSYLGSEVFAYVLPLVYFCLSRKAGLRLYLLYSVSGPLLDIFKLAFHAPRPYWVDSRVKELSGSGGYGMPSGHVQSAAVVWPFVAKTLGKPWTWVMAIVCVLLVSVSRVYLGVHFITDVVGAWVIGAGLIWGFDRIEWRLTNWLSSFRVGQRMAAAVWAAATLLCAAMGVRLLLNGIPDDPEWSSYAAGARNLSGAFSSIGEFFGGACGVILAARWARFELPKHFWKRSVTLGYAVLGGWLIKEAFRMIRSPQTEILQFVFDFSRGVVPHLWILFLAPWIMLKTRLLHAPDSHIACGVEARH